MWLMCFSLLLATLINAYALKIVSRYVFHFITPRANCAVSALRLKILSTASVCCRAFHAQLYVYLYIYMLVYVAVNMQLTTIAFETRRLSSAVLALHVCMCGVGVYVYYKAVAAIAAAAVAAVTANIVGFNFHF